MADQPLKVMVVDGHSVFAEALALAIDTTGGLRCVGTARDVEQAVTLANIERPDVAVMDAQPDAGDPIRPARQLLGHHPETRVLVLTGLPVSPALVREAADAGASGLFPKSVEPRRRRRDASRRSGRTPSRSTGAASSHSATPRPACLPPRPSEGGASTLTRRELDILGLLASGVDLQRASVRLGITVNTARGYVKNLYRKLGVHNQLELVAVARERGLLDTLR